MQQREHVAVQGRVRIGVIFAFDLRTGSDQLVVEGYAIGSNGLLGRGQNLCLGFFHPFGARSKFWEPQLAPWAAFYRRFGALAACDSCALKRTLPLLVYPCPQISSAKS